MHPLKAPSAQHWRCNMPPGQRNRSDAHSDLCSCVLQGLPVMNLMQICQQTHVLTSSANLCRTTSCSARHLRRRATGRPSRHAHCKTTLTCWTLAMPQSSESVASTCQASDCFAPKLQPARCSHIIVWGRSGDSDQKLHPVSLSFGCHVANLQVGRRRGSRWLAQHIPRRTWLCSMTPCLLWTRASGASSSASASAPKAACKVRQGDDGWLILLGHDLQQDVAILGSCSEYGACTSVMAASEHQLAFHTQPPTE